MKVDYIEMRIPSKPDFVGVVRLTLSGIASRMGYSYEDIEDLKIATSEAVTNAVNHAYNEGEDGEITIGFGMYEDHLQINVSDSGKSFNVDKAKEELGPYNSSTSLEVMNEGGLGLYLMDTLMDDVKINNHAGVSVLMKKYLYRERVGSDEESIATNHTE
ncbi:anti-sigma B factor RsbW [Bacillus sp. DJP31]|uniref:anti-sigma B factor RsbW n=1 Tax=Bacillus sp. DJP31 TaxID=3409789 RepID=UPI003BB70ECE